MSDTSINGSAAPKPKSAAAIVALVLGVIALVSSWVPIINNFAFIFGLVGAVFAVVALAGYLLLNKRWLRANVAFFRDRTPSQIWKAFLLAYLGVTVVWLALYAL